MRFDVFALGRASRPPRRTSTRVRGMVRRPLRSRFWRSGRIVRVRTSNTSGVIRMIPRFSRGGRRVRGGTILPERHFSRSEGGLRADGRESGADRGAAGPAGGPLPGGARFFSGRAGVLHIGRGGGRGSIVGFPRDSGKVILGSSEWCWWGLWGWPGRGRVQTCHKGALGRDRPRMKPRNINDSLPAFRLDPGLCGRFGQPAPPQAPRGGRLPASARSMTSAPARAPARRAVVDRAGAPFDRAGPAGAPPPAPRRRPDPRERHLIHEIAT